MKIKSILCALMLSVMALGTNAQEADTAATCEANDLAQYLAGKDNAKYASIQTSDHYKKYSKETDETWKELNQRLLTPIQNWSADSIPEFYNDSTTCFYPFGGPDLIFATTFFPGAKDYIMFGLEKPGELCDPLKLTELQRRQYLDSLQFTYRYLNKFGFFVARQMLFDFQNKNMNGTIHLALYTLAIEGCTVTNYRTIYIDVNGKIQDLATKTSTHPYGWELTFLKPGDSRVRTVRYFKFGAEDASFKGKTNFPLFLNSIPEKSCYLKSASYLMQNGEFTTMQNLIMSQCPRILMDESGFAYGRMKKEYDVRLYGTYTYPVRDFKWVPQTDLKNDLLAMKSKELPFKIGYAAQHNEGVLIVCTKNDKTDSKYTLIPEMKPTEGTIYKVEFLTSRCRLRTISPELNGLNTGECYSDGTDYHYVTGTHKTEQSCQVYLNQVKARGFADAKIVKFVDGQIAE
ncbi:MAG: hypothetical protein MJZ66_10980 [Bacteroidales bacterium]|nr:hypothetical protein [Bacteroidales bacterium]